MHRNSQRRPFRSFGYYFITPNVSQGFLILDTHLFGYLLEHVIHLAAMVNDCQIIAYKINPDHIHLLIRIGKEKTISQFMGSMKRNFSRQANSMLKRIFKSNKSLGVCSPGEDSNPRLVCLNKFKWQTSYHSHLITSRQDFENHVQYIKNQYIKHELKENKFYFENETHEFMYI
ncbi:MAG: transposase [Candidatus Marinimicrobia bacterium]|nr:transposase [Candidatus Neomarinimicrobiota bacterium]